VPLRQRSASGRSGPPLSRVNFGSVFVRGYWEARHVRDRLFTLAARGGFASLGPGTLLELPIRLGGVEGMAIGAHVFVGANSWFQVHSAQRGQVKLEIGDGTSIAGSCVVSAARSIRIGRKVLFARNVYVSDHAHAYEDPREAVLDQGLARIAPVEIGDGAWLGQNVVLSPGVTIGRGAVVGANSVVRSDVPAFSLAVGAPARVLRQFVSDDDRAALGMRPRG
jgi:acetyltransferase-like isoleucine patch superfamily enzyme